MSLIGSLIDEIIKLNPPQRKFLEYSVKTLDCENQALFTSYIQFQMNEELTIQQLATAYNLFLKSILKEQMFFQRKKHYRHSSYKDVNSAIYQNSEYMQKYMIGLGLSTFLWPNHRLIHKWFIEKIPKEKNGTYLEIGPGHGYFFLSAMKLSQYNSFLGIDISPTSIEMTRKIILYNAKNSKKDYLLINEDFFEISLNQAYDAIVMGEVLEHVECPENFLMKIESTANCDAFIFITTVINAAAIEHIYLFRTVEDIQNLVNRSGLKIKDMLVLPYIGLSLEECLINQLPINIAIILEKQKKC